MYNGGQPQLLSDQVEGRLHKNGHWWGQTLGPSCFISCLTAAGNGVWKEDWPEFHQGFCSPCRSPPACALHHWRSRKFWFGGHTPHSHHFPLTNSFAFKLQRGWMALPEAAPSSAPTESTQKLLRPLIPFCKAPTRPRPGLRHWPCLLAAPGQLSISVPPFPEMMIMI